ncbi:hypothetical protein [Microbacterium sp. A93]|uniref:hypothetical protein n=1 Tax=Microbacterium sp. A93 TaxID=3450716 RepID=UPI003F42403D
MQNLDVHLYGAFYCLLDEFAVLQENDAAEVSGASISVLWSDSDPQSCPAPTSVRTAPSEVTSAVCDDISGEERIARHAHLLTGIDWALDSEQNDEDDAESLSPEKRAAQLRANDLIKGSLWHASNTIIDRLLSDIYELDNADDELSNEDTVMLSDLPPRFAKAYRPLA